MGLEPDKSRSEQRYRRSVTSWLPLLILTAFVLAVGTVTWREHHALRASRRTLLSECSTFFDTCAITPGTAEFPSLLGSYQGREIHADLIPDTMTIRRLPQLWLSITLSEKLPIKSGFAILVRPSGNDYFSLTEAFTYTLAPSKLLPWEVLVRGETPGSQSIADQMADLIGAILADPRVKEVALTPRGARIVWQAAEGRRGEHLLLRQAVFDNAAVAKGDFERLVTQLLRLCDSVVRRSKHERAA